jgi:hypothetical protein
MNNLMKTLLTILLVMMMFMIMYYCYYGTDLSHLCDSFPMLPNCDKKQKITPTFTPTMANAVNTRLKELSNLKEQFISVSTPLNVDETNTIIQNLGLRDDELRNMNLAIDDYIDQIMQNEEVKETDKRKTLDLLAQIYAIKLNDSINKLNAVSLGEYFKSKPRDVLFTP